MKIDSGALTVPGNLNSIPQVRSWLEGLLLRWSAPQETVAALQSAATEICTNIARHGYGGNASGEIKLEAVLSSDEIEVIITDDAPAFIPGPEVRLPRQRLAEGGYGLFMVYSLMDQVTHEVLGEKGNRTTLVKRIAPPLKGPGNSPGNSRE